VGAPHDLVDVEPQRVAELQRAGSVQLIDVREGYEWDEARLDGARHLDLGSLAAEAATIDRERPVVFYCAVGSRSSMAAEAFRQAGYDAYSMAGGIERWAAEGLPVAGA
jgi:hydroxyacylglutathione hydrolase/adenylyltransferase/sulfurtransferase